MSRTYVQTAATIATAALITLGAGQAAHAAPNGGRSPSPTKKSSGKKSPTRSRSPETIPPLQLADNMQGHINRAQRVPDPTRGGIQNVYAEDPAGLLNQAWRLIHQRNTQTEISKNFRGETVYTVPFGRVIGTTEKYEDGVLTYRIPRISLQVVRGQGGRVNSFFLPLGEAVNLGADPGFSDRLWSHQRSNPQQTGGWGVYDPRVNPASASLEALQRIEVFRIPHTMEDGHQVFLVDLERPIGVVERYDYRGNTIARHGASFVRVTLTSDGDRYDAEPALEPGLNQPGNSSLHTPAYSDLPPKYELPTQ